MIKKNLLNKNTVFVLSAIAATALWGTAFPGIKLGYEWFGITDTGSKIAFAGIRFILAGLMLLGVFAVKEKKIPVIKADELPSVLSMALIQVAGDYFFYYLGLSVTSGGTAAVLNSFDTFCSVLIVSIFFKEDKLTVRKIIGCVTGFLGIILININGASEITFRLTGEGFIIISSLFATFGIIINKKAALKIDPFVLTGYYLFAGGIILLGISVPLKEHISFGSVKANLCLVYLSLVSAVAFFIWSSLLKHHDVSKTSMFKLMTPVFGNIFSAVALGENNFTPIRIASVALVAAGIGIVNYKKK